MQSSNQCLCEALADYKASFEMQEQHGFSLTLAPSAIDHPKAGIGVWLQGHASAGAVIGFYPGIVYTKAHYR